jgi:hypothetical protein
MKKIYLLILVLFSTLSQEGHSQNSNGQLEYGGDYATNRNDAKHPCATKETYRSIEKQLSNYAKLFGETNNVQKSMMVAFNWPLKMVNGLNDCSDYYIGNYLDQDPTSGIKDWNCGTVTYDGHAGTDICLCPYPWSKMTNSLVEVIAAAGGTISAKVDGNFDQNCASNTLTPNYMAVTHSDGSNSIYLHLKKNSLTTKTIGQTVIAGEYLGYVGSSGSSSGPHLHFEVWSGNTSATLKDSYSGACNVLNASSYWAAQKPYTEPAIIKAQINLMAPVFPTCPNTETSNEDSCFLPGVSARFYIFIRNETNGLVANMRIVNPGGSTFTSWIHNSTANYQAAYWYSIKTLPTTTGTYTFETIYNGITCSKTFSINCGVASGFTTINNLSQLQIYPTPTNDQLNLTGEGLENGDYTISLNNVLGQALIKEGLKIDNIIFQKTFSISDLPNGIYFITIENEKMKTTRKVIKQN